MKLKKSLKYILNSISYGVVAAIVLLVLMPELRTSNTAFLQLFNFTEKRIEPISYASAVRAAGPAVVNIYSEEIQARTNYSRAKRQLTDLGSGVIMADNGYILTNFHVVQRADLIIVQLQNGQAYPAELIGFDVYTDLAVLKVDAINLPVIPQRPSMQPLTGDVVLAIGNPFNLGQTVTQGIISATGRAGAGLGNPSYLNYLQMDAAINRGNSGGALVNTNGELVGINSLQYKDPSSISDIQGIFFSIPYDLAFKIMQKIIADGRVIRGWLGVDSEEYSTAAKGFVLNGLALNGPADQAGLKIHDIVYQIGDTPIESINQALDIVAETPPNTTLIFKIYRQKQQLDIPVKILERH